MRQLTVSEAKGLVCCVVLAWTLIRMRVHGPDEGTPEGQFAVHHYEESPDLVLSCMWGLQSQHYLYTDIKTLDPCCDGYGTIWSFSK